MKINTITLIRKDNYQELSGYIDNHRLWFRFPNFLPIDTESANSFMIAALLPAMLLKETIEIDPKYTVSALLYEKIFDAQIIFNTWNPLFNRINIDASTTIQKEGNDHNGVFFSGGIDATYSLLKHQQELDYLILINGFDFNIEQPVWEKIIKQNERFADFMGKQLIPVETNYKTFNSRFRISRETSFGCCMASIAQALKLKKVLVSSGETYRSLVPIGVYPLLDPLWSSEFTRIFHIGLEANRVQKVKFIASIPEAIENLHVCWENPDRNCGHCTKCLGSYIALELNNLQGIKYEQPPKLEDFLKIPVSNEHYYHVLMLILQQAKQKNHTQLIRILNKNIRKYLLKQFIVNCDTYYFSGFFKKLKYQIYGKRLDPVDFRPYPEITDNDLLKIVKADLSNKTDQT